MEEIERCILVKPEVFVYKIPPRQSARGYRAADWNLAGSSYCKTFPELPTFSFTRYDALT